MSSIQYKYMKKYKYRYVLLQATGGGSLCFSGIAERFRQKRCNVGTVPDLLFRIALPIAENITTVLVLVQVASKSM